MTHTARDNAAAGVAMTGDRLAKRAETMENALLEWEIRLRAVGLTIVAPLALGLAVSGCAPHHRPAPADDGGRLLAYIAEVDRLNARGEAKRLDGRCASACTVFLGVRRVCVTARARLWFHAAHTTAPTATPDPFGTMKMLAYYPARVREWAIRTRALEAVQFSDDKSLTGEQLVGMGVAPCVDD